MSQHLDPLIICERNNGRLFKQFSFVTATTIQQLKNSSNNENTVKSTTFWLSVWKKCCLEKRIPKEIENYEPTLLNTLLERFYAEIKTNMVKPRKRRFHFIESIRTKTEQFLELFSRTLNFLKPQRCENIIVYLTNREAWTVLCSVVKHAGSGQSTKEVSA